MIDKLEIADLARELSLDLHVVEKDYVLGWLLAGIAANPELSENWVFKGGTCLKNASSRLIGFPRIWISR